MGVQEVQPPWQAITALSLFQIKIVRLPIEVCLIFIQQNSIYKEMGWDGGGGGESAFKC